MNIKAQVTWVPIGNLTIEGLLLPDGSFGISLRQLRELAFPSTSQNNALRELKSACGKDFRILKFATEISNNPQWVISLEQLNFCLTELAFRGHAEARALVRLLNGLALHQLFCDAFGIKFEEEDRQLWLKVRQSTIDTFHPLTDELKRHGFTEPWEYGKFIHLFQQKLGIVDGTRDKQGNDKLNELMIAQATVTAYMKTGIKPYNALAMLGE